MSASTYVGRVGALAAAFGVGAAIFTGPAVAWADPSADAAGSAQDSQPSQASTDKASGPTRGQARGARGPRASASTAAQSAAKDSAPASDTAVADVAEVTVPEVTERDVTPRRGGDSAEAAPQQQADVTPGPAATTAAKTANEPVAVTPDASVTPVTAPAPAAAATVPAAAATQTVTSLIETVTTAVAPAPSVTAKTVAPTLVFPTVLANVANQISTVINSVVSQLVNTFSGYSPFGPQVDSPANWLLLAAARRQPLAAASANAVISTPAAPTLILNGYSVVPTSVEIVDAFTGRWAYWPGQPNMLQGRQDFTLVDPSTGTEGGTFSALVTSGDPTSIGARYVEMLVTSNDGQNVGTGAGQTPPVGSVISDFTLGFVGFSYSAMPSGSGDKVSVKLKTPFGSIPLPLAYNAAAGIADHTFDNRPMDVTGGFSIKPANPTAEKLAGVIGLLPLFNSIQGRQTFGVYDSDGKKVGSFDGEFTTTSDVIGISTQAILVTANDGINVGTKPGQTPPVGTVYNVAYFGSDKVWLLYSSMPKAAGGYDVSVKLGTPGNVTNLGWVPYFGTFNASKEPAMKSMIAPGGQKFVATSAIIPSGVNGLPPRDVQIQGYQQFDVYDFLGRKIGSVDADVENQWDAFGVHSRSILITKITAGEGGATPLNVPPVGTVMDFIDFGNGLGFADSVMTENGIDVLAWQLVTPFGNVPLLPTLLPSTRPKVEYYNPF